MTGDPYMKVAKSTDWQTPPALFDALDKEFGPFTLDPAAVVDGKGHVAETILSTVGHEVFWAMGLDRSWRLMNGQPSRVFLNPPYGRAMPKWIARAVAEVESGNCELVCALIPARTDTKCWQEYVLREASFDRIAARESLVLVRFLGASSPGMEGRSRVRFGGAPAGAPFPCAVVVWAGRPSCP